MNWTFFFEPNLFLKKMTLTFPSLKPCGILLYNQYSVINFNPIRQKQSNCVSLTHCQCWDDLEKQRIKRAVVRDDDYHHTWSRKIKKG